MAASAWRCRPPQSWRHCRSAACTCRNSCSRFRTSERRRSSASWAFQSAAAISRRACAQLADLLAVAADALFEGTRCLHFGLDEIVAHGTSHPDAADLVQAAGKLVECLDHLVDLT